jgi:hypothetical protein
MILEAMRGVWAEGIMQRLAWTLLPSRPMLFKEVEGLEDGSAVSRHRLVFVCGFVYRP